MLADDIAFRDLDSAHVRGWLDLLLPPGLRTGIRWALLVCNESTLHAVIVSGRGAVPVLEAGFKGTTRGSLAAVRANLNVDVVVAITPTVLEATFTKAERELDYSSHITAQAITWLNVWRSHFRRGVWMSPPLLDLIPPLRADALERTADLLVTDPSSLVAYVIADDRRSIEASVIAEFRGNRITEVSTHAAIEKQLPDASFARTWTSQYGRVLDLVGAQFARPSVGLFIEHGAARRILAGPPDQLQLELRRKSAIIDPMPRWLAGLLGGAAAVAVASRGAKRLSALLPERARVIASAAAKSASKRARESGAHPWQVLGFDPIELFGKLQRYYAA